MSGQIYPSFGLSGGTKTRGISGTTKSGKNCLDMHVVEGGTKTNYESKTFTISGAQSNYDVKTNQSMFSTVTTATTVQVYVDIAATVKLNAAGNDGIQMVAGEDFVVSGLDVTNLFITTTADTVVRVTMFS